MNNIELKELTQIELVEVNGGFGPLYYLLVAAYGAGVAHGYIKG